MGLSHERCMPAGVLSRFSHVRLCATPWPAALQAPLSMGFSGQEYWSGLLYPPPGDLHDPGFKPESPTAPALQADSSVVSDKGSPVKRCLSHYLAYNRHSINATL